MPTRRHLNLTILAALLLLAVSPQTVEARRGAAMPISLRLTVYIGDPPPGQKPDYRWTAEHKKKRYVLNVMKVSIVGSVLASDIDRAVNPYKVSFQLAGNSAAIKKLDAVPAQQQVVIAGYLRMSGGSRMLMVDTVESGPTRVAPAPEPVTAP